ISPSAPDRGGVPRATLVTVHVEESDVYAPPPSPIRDSSVAASPEKSAYRHRQGWRFVSQRSGRTRDTVRREATSPSGARVAEWSERSERTRDTVCREA